METKENSETITQRKCKDYTFGTGPVPIMNTAEGCCVCAKGIKGGIHEPDSAWAWFICLVGLTSIIVITGFVFSFGVLNPVFLQEFHEGKARTGILLRQKCLENASVDVSIPPREGEYSLI